MEPFLETSSCSRPDALELHSPDRKGVEDGIGAIGGQKRQRALLSDDEETSLPIPKSQESSKRRCLEPVGDENIDPLHRWPGSPERSRLRQQEQEVKPDTPAVSSVRARLQWLGQKQGDGAVPQRCLSDPVQGEPTCSLELHSIGNVEFHSRVERFETPPQSPAFFTPRSQVPSNLTRSMQQKLQSANTPSSVRASRIRQERQEELRLLRSQPIAENAWMKRSLSDPSLAEVEASETRASNDEQPRPACSGDPACLLEPSKELHSSAGEQEGRMCPTGKHFLPAEMLSSGEQQEQKVPSPEERQKIPAEMLEGSACFFGKQELEFLPSDIMEFTEGRRQAGLESPGDEQGGEEPRFRYMEEQVEGEGEQGEEERQPPCVEEEQVEGEREQGEEERQPSCVEEERQPPCVEEEQVEGEGEQGEEERQPPCVEEERQPPCVEEEQVEGEGEQGEEERQPPCVEEERQPPCVEEERQPPCVEEEQVEGEGEQGEEEQQLAGEEEEQPTCVEGQGQTKEALSVEEQGQVEDPGVEEQNVLHTVLRGQDKVSSVRESKVWSRVSEMKEAPSDKDLSEEMSTSGMIDQLFARVLDTEEEEEDKRRKGHCDSDAAEGKGEEMGLATEGVELESRSLDSSTDELLTLPSSCILSPLSKSVEAVVTDLRLASSCLPDVTSVDCVPEGPHDPPPSSTPLYSIDAYRTQLQNSRHAVHIVTPTASGQRPQASCPQPLINTKDRIKALSEDVAKLQVVITQTLQALSCCTDEDHWKGSPMEAEAEKLLLVSCEKRTALLAEVAQLRAGVESGDAVTASPSQEPCRGTVTIANIRLPLKVDFVCSSLTLAGRPTHYFFVLIRYGACNIVATPLAIAADAQTGDSISFPTSVTLQDIRSNFEIDVEVYSLSQTPGNAKNFNTERFSKSKVTPKKLLSSIKRTNHNAASTALTSVGPQRSSNFCLVGSHKLTLASLGQTKFPLDKMKFDGKVRKLLGDEFQEKVPFLSPLEGNIYLQLNYESHSNVQHKGFLTMFEAVCGLGSWQRRWFSLEGNLLLYWNSPSSEGSKPPEGSISLASRAYQCVRLVTRDSCARPHTFELVSYKALQEDSGVTLDKHWFSADTREERAEWMKKLNQALLDLHTWTCCPGGPEPPRPCRESML
ncbi:anillin, actin binding protein 2 isoform X2 [Paramormyrops kingsleyae]|uniref:anillin, actin binding protein 2 isoform X2 n=1 Tax=Paramormyrops kingsleyae TaxID=1676925 RepID=UPI003B96FAF7